MQVSASAYSTETVPLMSLYPEIRETFSTACSFDTFLQFIHATSKLVGDEAGPASGFGSVKQLDDVLSALVATSQDRPAEIWDQCETDCDDSYDESVDCLQKTCNKMIGMQQNALDKISLAIGSCDAGPANVSMALAMSEDVELFGPPVNYHIEGGEWYYTEDVSSSEDDWGECDGVSNDNTHPPVKVKTLAKWVGRRHHPLGHSCFSEFSVDAYVPPQPLPPPPPNPPPLPPFTYDPRRHIAVLPASGPVVWNDPSSDKCRGGFDSHAGLGGTIVVIKDLDDPTSTDLINFDYDLTSEKGKVVKRADMLNKYGRMERSDCALECFGKDAGNIGWCIHFRFSEVECELLPLRQVGIFQGDVATPSHESGVMGAFARVLNIQALAANDSWVIIPAGSDDNFTNAAATPYENAAAAAAESAEPDYPYLVRYNQPVRLRLATDHQSYLKLNAQCTAGVGGALRARLQQYAEQPPHPPPPSPAPAAPSPSPAPMPPGGVSLSSLGASATAQHKLQLWDWANNTQYGLLDVAAFHGDAGATPSAFKVLTLSGDALPPQPRRSCSAFEDAFAPEAAEGHSHFNSSYQACEAWAVDTSPWGALAHGHSLESSCAKSAVGLANCSRTCCTKTQPMVDEQADVLGLFPVGGSHLKRFDARQCTKQVNPLLFLPSEGAHAAPGGSDDAHTRQWLQPRTKTAAAGASTMATTEATAGGDPNSDIYIYNKAEAEAECIAEGCEGLAQDLDALKARPDLCLQGWVERAETTQISNDGTEATSASSDYGWYMSEGGVKQCGRQFFNRMTDSKHVKKGAYCRNCPAYPQSACDRDHQDAMTQAHPFTTESAATWSTQLAVVRMSLVDPYGDGTAAKVSADQEGPLIDGDLVGFYACHRASPSDACTWLPFVVNEGCFVDTPEGWAPSSWFKLSQW